LKRIAAACALALVLLPGPALGWHRAPGRAHVPIPEGVRVPTWRELTEAQRADLADYAERWDRLPASRRVAILERHARWQQASPETRRQIREGQRTFHRMTPEQREAMRRSMAVVRALPVEEQRQLRQRWRAMSPVERGEWLDRGGPGVAPPP
jgi:hypothetical protein